MKSPFDIFYQFIDLLSDNLLWLCEQIGGIYLPEDAANYVEPSENVARKTLP